MRLKEDFNQLTVQETPGCLWLFGSFFASIGGVFVYGSLGGFSNYAEIAAWQLLTAFLMGASAVAAGIWIIYNAPANKVVIKRQSGIVVHQTFRLSGKKMKTYTFDQLKQFILIEEFDDESNPIWFLGMEFHANETVKISSMPSHSEKFKRDFVFQINEFLQKPLPTYKNVDELEDESETKIS